MGASRPVMGVKYRVKCPGGAPIHVAPGDNEPIAWLISDQSPIIVCDMAGDFARIAIPIQAYIRRDKLERFRA